MPRVKPVCMVPTCRKEQAKFPNETFYTLPPKGEFRDSWLKVVNVEGLDGSEIAPNSKHYRVCSIHFALSDFERDLQSELLGINKPKKLKRDAIPWLFLPPPKEENFENETVNPTLEGNINIEENTDKKTDNKARPFKKSRKAVGLEKTQRNNKKSRSQFGCLVCAKSPVGRDYTSKFNHPGANNHELLNKQLWHIFVLKNILKFSSLKCQQLLERFGKTRHPESWFHLCSKCSSDIATAMGLHEEILRLQLKMSDIFEKLCNKAKMTVETEKHTVLEKNEVEIELWTAIGEANGVISELADEIKIEPVETEFMEDDDDLLHASCTEESNNDDLASRIDRILQQNAAIVGEPISRPVGFESDSGSDDDDNDTTTRQKRNKKSVVQRSRMGVKGVKTSQLSSLTDLAVGQCSSITSFKPRILGKPRLRHNKFIRLKCLSCLAAFYSEELFSKHNEDHQISMENGKIYDCNFCGWVIPNETLRAQHLRIRHKDENNKQDNGKGCIYQNMAQQEIESLCKAISSSKVQLDSFKFDECPFCMSRYTNLLNFENHLKLHEKNADGQSELNCSYQNCGFTFKNKYRLKQHLRKFHKEHFLTNTCETCGFTVSKFSKGKWQAHLLKHKLEEFRITESGQFECSMCQAIFETNLSLTRHMKVSHAAELGIERFLCTDCPRTFCSKRGVEIHAKMFHDDPDGFSGQCDVCGQSFLTQHTLEVHMRSHDKNKFICDKCGGEFNCFANLRDHKKKLYGEDIQSTTTKEKRKSKSTEQQQQQISIKESWRRLNSQKPQRCKYCQITLPHFAALRRHVKVHAKIQCDICGNSFMTNNNLYKHTKLVHQSNSSTKANCQYCGKEFKHKISVLNHYHYCRFSRKLRVKTDGGNNELFQCSHCKRPFRSKMALNGHLPFCRRQRNLEEERNSDPEGKQE